MSPNDQSSIHDDKGPDESHENSQAEISRAGSVVERSKSEMDKSMIQALSELKDKFKINYRSDEQIEQQLQAEEEGEKCLIKISNYREDTGVQSTSKLDMQSQGSHVLNKEDSKKDLARSPTPQTQGSGKGDKEKKGEEAKQGEEVKDGEGSQQPGFNYDDLPLTCKMLNALQPTHEMNILVQHVEAGFQVKKHLFDVAQKVFATNLQEGYLNMFMAMTGDKNKILNEKMDKFLAETCGFGEGQKFEDKNSMIVYKTFLDSSTDDKTDLLNLLDLYMQREAEANAEQNQ